MSMYASPSFLDGGLTYLRAATTKMLLIKNYSFGDSYATVLSNKLAEVSLTPADFVIRSAGDNRQIVLPVDKTALANGNSVASDNLHIAFTDGSAAVHYVVDETTNQVIITDNLVAFPNLTYTCNQPTA